MFSICKTGAKVIILVKYAIPVRFRSKLWALSNLSFLREYKIEYISPLKSAIIH
jgi:hypothetical protein